MNSFRSSEQRRIPSLESCARTIRLAGRSLRRAPGFAVAAILTLALGIGLATTVFTIADAMALRRLPIRDQERVVILWGRSVDGRFDNYPITGVKDFVRQSRLMQQVAYFAWFGSAPVAVQERDAVTRLRRAVVSGEYFNVLGTRAVIGRTLNPDDDAVGAPPAAVISYRTWEDRYGSDPHVLDRSLALLDGSHSYAIVGVLPKGFAYPAGTDFWTPVATSFPQAALGMIGFDAIGRLAPNATATDAAAELTTYFGRPEASPAERNLRGVAHSFPDLILGDAKSALIAFSLAAALLLLMSCVNVANLLIVRGLARVREVAVRRALGAGGSAVTGQLMTENALLAVAGGLLGLLIAAATVRIFVAFAPPGTPRLDEIHLSGAAFAGAVGITAVAVLVFGLAPAIMTARTDVHDVLRATGRQTLSKGRRLTFDALVSVQFAFALVVVSAAALIARSLVELERVPLGFVPAHLLVADLAFRAQLATKPGDANAGLELLLPRLHGIPGVVAASPVVAAPFSGSSAWSGRPRPLGQSPEDATSNPIANMDLVGTEYFEAMGMPILRGRPFSESDGTQSPHVVVISRSAAEAYWPREDALGQRMTLGAQGVDTFTVVGIVPDTRYRALREGMPSIFFPLRQSIFPVAPTLLVIRTTGPPEALVPAVRQVVAQEAPGIELVSANSFTSFLDVSLGQPRLDVFLLSIFAVAALVLSGVGLFGLMAATVRHRTQEIGIRAALGATPDALVSMITRRGLTVALVGVFFGVGAALATNQLLSALLYLVRPTDATTLAAASIMFGGVALLASYIPARAAAGVNTVQAVKADA